MEEMNEDKNLFWANLLQVLKNKWDGLILICTFAGQLLFTTCNVL